MQYARFVIQLTGIAVPPSYHLHRHTRTEVYTHTHPRMYVLLTAAVSAGLWPQRGGYYMNQPHTTVVFTVL